MLVEEDLGRQVGEDKLHEEDHEGQPDTGQELPVVRGGPRGQSGLVRGRAGPGGGR